jgi:RNA polymerase sigma factor (TIGR02999 family)
MLQYAVHGRKLFSRLVSPDATIRTFLLEHHMQPTTVKPLPGRITAILSSLNSKDSAAWTELAPLVYAELKELAKVYMRQERAGHVLQPTALVHETYLRLVRHKEIQWRSRVHFYGVAALLMRYILVEHARRRRVEQRALTVTGFQLSARPDAAGVDLEALDEALTRLARMDPRQCRVVELRYFGGMSTDEAAEILDVSPKTVKRDWAVARAWLHGELTKPAR